MQKLYHYIKQVGNYARIPKKIIPIIFSFLLAFQPFVLKAQQYPVKMVPVLLPPYSLKLSEYATSTQTKLRLQVMMTDLQEPQHPTGIKFSLESSLGAVPIATSQSFVSGMSPFTLYPGSNITLTNVDLRPLFELQNLSGLNASQYAQTLPEGIYQFCFQAYDYYTKHNLSAKTCAQAYLTQYEPPLLNLPQNAEKVQVEGDILGSKGIVFQWMPRQVAPNTRYIFTLKELWDLERSTVSGFLSSPILWKEKTYATSLYYGPEKTRLIPGKRYAWQVQAVSGNPVVGANPTEDNGVYKNNGLSEIFYFDYVEDCKVPTFLMAKNAGRGRVELSWTMPGQPKGLYSIQYRKRDNHSDWQTEESYQTRYILTGLENQTEYEYRIGTVCGNLQNFNPSPLEGETSGNAYAYSAIQYFTTDSEDEENINYQCGVMPDIDLTNRTPLQTVLGTNEVFMAGDFPVTVISSQGSNGIYSGEGYIEVPYLGDTKIKVVFNNIKLNTDKQLIEGVVETTYDVNESAVSYASAGLGELFGDKNDNNDEGNEDYNQDNNGQDNSDNGQDNDNESDEESNDESNDENSGIDNTDDSDESSDEGNSDTDNENNEDSEGNEDSENNEDEEDVGIDDNAGDNDFIENDKKLFILNSNNRYYDNDRIKLFFKRNDESEFFLKGIEDSTKVIFNNNINNSIEKSVSQNGQKLKLKFKKSIGKELSFFLQPYLKNDKSKKLQVNLIIKKKNYSLEKFKTIDAYNDKRVAKNNETLYFINNPNFRTDKRKAYSYINSNININYIPSKEIQWSVNGEIDYTQMGDKRFKYNYREDNNYVIKLESPKYKFKNYIKFEDENRRSWSFVPPAMAAVIKMASEKVDKGFKEMDKYAKISKYVRVQINPIKIMGEKYNEEDKNSRLFKQVEEGSASGGIKITSRDALITHPLLQGLSRSGIADIGFYANISASVDLKGGVRRYKFIESDSYINNQPFLSLGPSGCLEAGLKAELLIAKDLVDFEVRGYTQSCLAGNVRYNFNSKVLKGEIYIPPITLNGRILIRSKGQLNFELVDFNSNISITPKVKIYELEHQF
ncbi:TANFOR domain [Candidatus Ornithobacterium hominis]|uniref:TANFOR domain n=1 Tax=Candidatus Ornithobacterium hominis TaxID=2497989 RepID=A0A383TZR4_9FLAO|nr:fibronectin type III domain-containing protein [Candidatus Ornithobacterium hominis]SZD73104.1 TANFOR domain [Candidatus Ornithobacterium hominis]